MQCSLNLISSWLVLNSPIFYGYVVAVFGTMGVIATGPGQTPVIGTAISRIAEELGMERTSVSSLYLLATLGSACTLPFVGRLLDRFGPPPMFAAAALGLSCTCFVFATFVRSGLTLGVAFYFLRLFGQGSLTLVSQNAINLWFQKRRGRVMGVSAFCSSLCLTGLFSSITKELVARLGWRPTYLILSQIELFCVLPLGILFLKQKPEEYGLLPDGETISSEPSVGDVAIPPTATDEDEELPLKVLPADASLQPVPLGKSECAESPERQIGNGTHSGAAKEDFTYGEAIRTLGFWSMSMGAFTIAALGTALFFHMDVIFSGSDYSEHLTRIYLSSATAAAVTTLGAGFLIDIIKPQLIMTASLSCNLLLLLTSGLVVRKHMNTRWFFCVGLLNGLSSGSFNACISVAYASWFGRTHNGKIQGLASSLTVLGSAVGPAVVSLGHDFVHEYHDVLLVLAVWPFLCACFVYCTCDPKK